jgi:hypothetical protein
MMGVLYWLRWVRLVIGDGSFDDIYPYVLLYIHTLFSFLSCAKLIHTQSDSMNIFVGLNLLFCFVIDMSHSLYIDN